MDNRRTFYNLHKTCMLKISTTIIAFVADATALYCLFGIVQDVFVKLVCFTHSAIALKPLLSHLLTFVFLLSLLVWKTEKRRVGRLN